MGKIQVVIPDEIEQQIRPCLKKKGDLSRITTDALQLWLVPESERGEVQIKEIPVEVVKDVPVVPPNYVKCSDETLEFIDDIAKEFSEEEEEEALLLAKFLR